MPAPRCSTAPWARPARWLTRAANTLGGNGYFYGVGVDYALNDQVVLGAEVLRHEFDDFDNTPGLDVGATTVGVSAALRF